MIGVVSHMYIQQQESEASMPAFTKAVVLRLSRASGGTHDVTGQ